MSTRSKFLHFVALLPLLLQINLAHADAENRTTGAKVAASLAFAAETANIGSCFLQVTSDSDLNDPAHAAYRPGAAARVHLTDGNGTSAEYTLQPQDRLRLQDFLSPQGQMLRVVSSDDGKLYYQRNSDLIFISVGGVSCGQRL